MDITYLAPPTRPEGFGITAAELAKQTGYTHDGARRILVRQDNLVAVTMRDKGVRVSVYVEHSKAESDEWYKKWMKGA